MLRRQLHIVKYIERNPYATREQVFDYLEREADIQTGLSKKTFGRDIKDICDDLNIVIEYDKVRH